MNYLFNSIIPLILLSEDSNAYKIGFAIGSFLGLYWAFLLAGAAIYLVFIFKKKSQDNKS